MTEEKVIDSRRKFADDNDFLSQLNIAGETSVDFREALYTYRTKIEKHIINPFKEIFKIAPEIQKQLQDRNIEIYEAGKQFAEVLPEQEGAPYQIPKQRSEEWGKVAKKIDEKYADALATKDKMTAESEVWMDKKIQLTIKKIELNQIPSTDSSSFYRLAKIFAINNVEEDSEEGKEIE